MNPKSRLRSPARCGSLRSATSIPSSRYEPVVGRSRQPMMLSSVVLPDPDAPTTATHSPTPTSRSTSRSAPPGASAPNVRPTSASATIGRVITSATARADLLEANHDEVAVREHALERRHGDVAVRRQTGSDGHDLEPLTGGPLHPGPSVRPERDGAQRDRELRAPGRIDGDRQPQR